MFYQVYAIIVKDLRILARDPGALAVLFAMPIVFILVMSVALEGVFTAGTRDNPVEVLVVNEDAGDLATQALKELGTVNGLRLITTEGGTSLTRAMAEKLIVDDAYEIALLFPTDFSERIVEAATNVDAPKAVVTFVTDPATSAQLLGPVRGSVQGFVERTAALSQAPRQLEAAFDTIVETVPAQQIPTVNQVASSILTQVGTGATLVRNTGVRFEESTPDSFIVEETPNSAEQNVPGYTIFGVFFIILSLATSLLEEKQDGTFRRLLTAPLSRAALLLGKLLPYYLINLIQITSMLAIGALVFKMNLGNSPIALIALSLATAATATSLGLFVASIGKTPEQVNGMATLLAVTLAALGGMFVPSFILPKVMQTMARLTPHAWALAGYQDLIVRGKNFEAIVPELGALMLFTLAFFTFALLRFRFE